MGKAWRNRAYSAKYDEGLMKQKAWREAGRYVNYWASQVALVVKNLPANTGEVRDVGLIPGWRRSPGGGHSNPLQWTEEPGRLQSTGSQRVRHG